MLSGVPNLAFALGYTNASWTLKCDLDLRVRLPAAQPHGRARLRAVHAAQPRPLGRRASRSSTSPPATCSARSTSSPSRARSAPWRLHQNYALRHAQPPLRAELDDGALRFSHARAPRRRRCRGAARRGRRVAARCRASRRCRSPSGATSCARSSRRTPPGFDVRLGDNNIFPTLARHPELFRAWLPFGGFLLGRGVLPARERELLILRTGAQLRLGLRVGTARAPRRIARHRRARRSCASPRAPTRPGWAPADATLLRAADELHAQAKISDGTWALLAESYDERGAAGDRDARRALPHGRLRAELARRRARRRLAGPALDVSRAQRRSDARQRRGRDSNPRTRFPPLRDFQSRPFNRSGTSPALAASRRRIADRGRRGSLKATTRGARVRC